MSIDVRKPESRPTRGSRAGTSAPVDGVRPSGELLPSGGAPSPAPALTPQRALALDALRVMRHIRGSAAAEAPWEDVSFGRQVESVRRQLAPIRSRSSLAASFDREAFHIRRQVGLSPDVEGMPAATPPGPVRLAYALRWLELGDGRLRPAWPDLAYRSAATTR
jgi:hypothetical protein